MSDVDALLAEREGYVRRGLKDRVAAVDASLAAFGVAVETTTAEPVENASMPKPRRRKADDSE